jgi:hypothetical protein
MGALRQVALRLAPSTQLRAGATQSPHSLRACAQRFADKRRHKLRWI